jgi:hypothetical protein
VIYPGFISPPPPPPQIYPYVLFAEGLKKSIGLFIEYSFLYFSFWFIILYDPGSGGRGEREGAGAK